MAKVINQSTMMGTGSSVSMNGSTFQVGLQGGALKSVASGLPGGVTVSGNAIGINQAGAVLDGYDLRGYSVTVQANNVTIKNSLLTPPAITPSTRPRKRPGWWWSSTPSTGRR
jgi:hypothetical protein